jgi:phage terminase large subunit-like protein
MAADRAVARPPGTPARQLASTLDLHDKIVRNGNPALLAAAGRTDLFFLMTRLLGRRDLCHQWYLSRADEVQAHPNGYIDLWAREHGKSSLITVGLTIQDLLRNPELTFGIFSHTRPIAKAFLRQIKREFESNELLKKIYPDVLWADPAKEAPTWSEDTGIILKRRGNPKEATIEAHGLVDGQPVSRHYDVLLYDDVVTRENAASPLMRAQTLEALRLSYALGKRGGVRRFVGTRYHYADAYSEVLKSGSARPRIYPAEIDGVPMLMTREELEEKRRDMGSHVFAAQMMLDPRPQDGSGFNVDNLRFYEGPVQGNRYVLVDPANEKSKKSDYTALVVVCLAADNNYYVEHMIRDRLNLRERVELVMWAHREFQPIRVGYEKYGMLVDVQAIRDEQRAQNYRFEIVELGGNRKSKSDRISELIPIVEAKRLYLPKRLTIRTKDNPQPHNPVEQFIVEEFSAWPYAPHDDMMDCLSRIVDPQLGAVWPRRRSARGGVWVADEWVDTLVGY